MASTYSDRLRIQLIGNGEQSGTWGNTTNTNLGVLVEEAIAGVVSIAMSDANYTLSVANGATDESRQAVLVVSGSLSTMRDVICPAEEKIYVIKNGTSGAQSIRLKTSGGSGVIVPNGQTTILYCDGTNVLPAVDTLPGNSLINDTLLVSGATSIDNSVIINDSGADKDFRVEGDTNQNLLFTDASTDRVGIGTGTPAARLHVLTNDGGTNTRLSGASYALRFQSVAATGSVFDATRADESTYQPLLIGGSQTRFTLSGIEVARLIGPGYFGIGTTTPSVHLEVAGDTVLNGSVVINEAGADKDFRVEGDTNANLLFADASTDRVGLGTNTPAARLHVSTNDGGTNTRLSGASYALRFQSVAATGSVFEATSADESTFQPLLIGGSEIRFTTSGGEKARLTAAGELYIAGTTDQGAYNLQVNGTGVWGAGAYLNGSDSRIKEDVSTITTGLDVITKLRPVQFRYKEDWSKDRSLQPGFIAQELQVALAGKAYAEGVVQEGPQYMSVAYQTLIPVLTKAIQELKDELDVVKAELETLKGA
jgi:Chaperone of endosialidase